MREEGRNGSLYPGSDFPGFLAKHLLWVLVLFLMTLSGLEITCDLEVRHKEEYVNINWLISNVSHRMRSDVERKWTGENQVSGKKVQAPVSERDGSWGLRSPSEVCVILSQRPEALGLCPKAWVTFGKLLSPNGYLYKQSREMFFSSNLQAVFQVTAFSSFSPEQNSSGVLDEI